MKTEKPADRAPIIKKKQVSRLTTNGLIEVMQTSGKEMPMVFARLSEETVGQIFVFM